jgi:hypothetical protein
MSTLNQAMNQENDERLLKVFTQLAGHIMERGLQHARRDDPHAYGQAVKFGEAGGGKFQMRIDVDPAGLEVRGLVVDDDGEALAQIFAINAQLAKVGH